MILIFFFGGKFLSLCSDSHSFAPKVRQVLVSRNVLKVETYSLRIYHLQLRNTVESKGSVRPCIPPFIYPSRLSLKPHQFCAFSAFTCFNESTIPNNICKTEVVLQSEVFDEVSRTKRTLLRFIGIELQNDTYPSLFMSLHLRHHRQKVTKLLVK